MEDKVRNQKKERAKTAAKRRAALIKLSRKREALAGTEEMARLREVTGLSENSLKAILSPTKNTPSSVREILANSGYPIEEIISKILIPKLYAKKIQVTSSRGKAETMVVDDHDVQLKTALELAKMSGCYVVYECDQGMGNTKPGIDFDLTGATHEEYISIIRIVCAIKQRNSGDKS